jgi:hypothetical protein
MFFPYLIPLPPWGEGRVRRTFDGGQGKRGAYLFQGENIL